VTASTRNRKGSQLSFELPSELLEQLRAYAQSERRTVAALLRGWIEAGLAQQSGGLDIHSKHNELSDLVDLVVSLKAEVEELQKWRKSQIPGEKKWVEDLRLKIKRAHGRGWTIRATAGTKLNPDGKCQLTRIAENRKRTSVILPLNWKEDESTAIFEIVNCICTMHVKQGLSLQDAFKSCSLSE
jgi:predicted transcriptional regulator